MSTQLTNILKIFILLIFTALLFSSCSLNEPSPIAILDTATPLPSKTPIPPTQAQTLTLTLTCTETKAPTATQTPTPLLSPTNSKTATLTSTQTLTPTKAPREAGIYYDELRPGTYLITGDFGLYYRYAYSLPDGKRFLLSEKGEIFLSPNPNYYLLESDISDDGDSNYHFLNKNDGQTTTLTFAENCQFQDIDANMEYALLFCSENGKNDIYVQRLSDKEIIEISWSIDDDKQFTRAGWSPNGEFIKFFIDEGGNFLTRADCLSNPETCKDKTMILAAWLCNDCSYSTDTWSPDNKRVASISGNKQFISIMDSVTGWYFLGFEYPGIIESVAWGDDDSVLYYSARGEEGEKAEIRYHDFATNEDEVFLAQNEAVLYTLIIEAENQSETEEPIISTQTDSKQLSYYDDLPSGEYLVFSDEYQDNLSVINPADKTFWKLSDFRAGKASENSLFYQLYDNSFEENYLDIINNENISFEEMRRRSYLFDNPIRFGLEYSASPDDEEIKIIDLINYETNETTSLIDIGGMNFTMENASIRPSISPDGNWILFMNEHCSTSSKEKFSSEYLLFDVFCFIGKKDCEEIVKPISLPIEQIFLQYVSWSPDSEKIAGVSYENELIVYDLSKEMITVKVKLDYNDKFNILWSQQNNGVYVFDMYSSYLYYYDYDTKNLTTILRLLYPRNYLEAVFVKP